MNTNPLPFKKRENPLEPTAQATQKTATPRETVQSTPAPATRHVVERVKYTATMEKGLRKRTKKALAELDMDFSKFIEECVREKLERGGF